MSGVPTMCITTCRYIHTYNIYLANCNSNNNYTTWCHTHPHISIIYTLVCTQYTLNYQLVWEYTEILWLKSNWSERAHMAPITEILMNNCSVFVIKWLGNSLPLVHWSAVCLYTCTHTHTLTLTPLKLWPLAAAYFCSTFFRPSSCTLCCLWINFRFACRRGKHLVA